MPQPKGRQNIENIAQKLQKDNLSNRNPTGKQPHFEAATSGVGSTENDDESSVINPEKARNAIKRKGVSPRKKTASRRKKVTPVKCRGKNTEMFETPCLDVPVTQDFTELNTDIKPEISNSVDNLLIGNDGVRYNIIGEVMKGAKLEPLSLENISLQGSSVEGEHISSRQDIVIGSEVKSLINPTGVNENLVQTITNGIEKVVDEIDSENIFKVPEHASKENVPTIDTCDKNCELPTVTNEILPTKSKEFNRNDSDTDFSRKNRKSVSDNRSRVNIFEKMNCKLQSHINPDCEKKNSPTVKNSPVTVSGSSDNRTERININKNTIRNVPQTFGSRKCSIDENAELTLNDFTSDELLSILEADTKLIRCDCSLIFTDEIMYFLHRNAHGSGGKLRCGFCDYEASDKYFFMIHQIHSHGCSGNPN